MKIKLNFYFVRKIISLRRKLVFYIEHVVRQNAYTSERLDFQVKRIRRGIYDNLLV